jgi:hypothetical protein
MKVAITLAVVAAMLTGILLAAQQDEQTAPANDSAKTTYASTEGGYGDLAASHAYEMSSVACELDGKLSSKTAKVSDRVVLRTTSKIISPDGTEIPSGTLLVGHVTEVQAYDPDLGPARIAIAFDHAELKKGKSLAIYVLVRNVKPAGRMNADPNADESMVGMPVSLGEGVNGGRMSPNYSTSATMSGDSTAANQVNRDADPAARSGNRTAGDAETPGATAQTNGDVNGHTGAHELAAARAVPHATDMPGVMLAGNSSSSGVLLAPIKDIQLESGTQFRVGVAPDR